MVINFEGFTTNALKRCALCVINYDFVLCGATVENDCEIVETL